VLGGIFSLAKHVFSYIKNEFKKKNDKTLALQRSVREARTLHGKE
jgi:hypothetical protein